MVTGLSSPPESSSPWDTFAAPNAPIRTASLESRPNGPVQRNSAAAAPATVDGTHSVATRNERAANLMTI
jgi:hypothetical protein